MTKDLIKSRISKRRIENFIRRIEEHLEALQRDSHSPEYKPWKNEVDTIWKQIFEEISLMPEPSQMIILELIREPWTNYISHYSISENQTGPKITLLRTSIRQDKPRF